MINILANHFSFFGKAFEQAAHKSRAEVIMDYFDNSGRVMQN